MTCFEYLSYFTIFAGNETTNGTRKTSHPPSTGRETLLLRLRRGSLRPLHQGRDRDFLRLHPQLRAIPREAVPQLEDRRCYPRRRADCEGREPGTEDWELAPLFCLRGFASGGTAAYWFSSQSRMELDTPSTLL